MFGVTIDITEQKQIEQALRIKDSAIESSITAIALADLEGHLTYVNHTFLELWKFSSPEEALGRSAMSFWEKTEEAQAIIQEIQSKQHVRGQMRAHLNDGTMADLELVASLVLDANGQAICMMGWFTDITQQLQAEHLRLEQVQCWHGEPLSLQA